jgi:uncharacterized protein YjbJ (UPF0337 family)
MSGKTDQMKGRAKEAAGSLTGSKKLESEGKADRRGGEIKQRLEQGTDMIEGFFGQGWGHGVKRPLTRSRVPGNQSRPRADAENISWRART